MIWALAWPTMLEELMQTAVQYVDTFMVASLGTEATATVGSTTTVNWLIGSAVYALGVGFLAYISQALGAGDTIRAKRASGQAVLLALFTGALFTALTLSLSRFVPVWMQVDAALRPAASRYFFILYSPMLFRCAGIIFGTVLRAAGDTKTPMRVGVLVNAANVLLNFLLIYPTRQARLFGFSFRLPGAGLGTDGAALASAVSFALGGILLTVSLMRHPTVSPVGARILPDKAILAPCMRIALPNMAQRFFTSLGYVVFASMINALGQVSTAAHTIANTVESAFYIPGYGMQSAAATLTGNAIGAKKTEEIKPLTKMIALIEIALMLVSGSLLFIFAPKLVGVFSKDAAVIALGATVLRMVAVSEPFYGVSIITEGILQGAGKTSIPFVFNILCMWGVRIVGTFICTSVLGLGLVSAWGCMIADNMLLLVLFRCYYHHVFFNRKKETAS
ncbi:MAG: MATE family efflux transporter [Clostridia bacterium]|nr:MATE family efflux transporter [Clostridia bacterium]